MGAKDTIVKKIGKTMSSKIKSFSINGLFGTSNVHIKFDENIKILVGENGLGKTQALNLFYYMLTKDFFRLNEYKFDKLTLTFSNNKSIEITKQSITELVEETFKHPLIKDIIEDIGFAQFEMLRNRFAQNKGNWEKMEEQFILSNPKLRHKYPIIRKTLIFEMERQRQLSFFDLKFDEFKKEITNEIRGIDIIYFPTFRRVEEDLHNLGYGENDLNFNQENTLIQFGMGDVQKKFDEIESTIDKLLKEGLTQFTKDILSVVIDDSTPTEIILNKTTENDIEIILSRVGNLLPDTQKQAVKDIVLKKQLKNPLSAYLLQKLAEIYEKQKKLDNSIKVFRDICNKYLINKQVFYDESGINIFIKSDLTGDKIQLKHLSSGEKQIISIFSKIYLSEANKKFIVLFDEPELSLSMTWQKQLLPDIVNSKKCEFLLAVTHSPFIFDNELDAYAVGLNEYIKPTKEAIAQ